MTNSKKIPILKPFLHPVSNKPIYNVTKEKISELGITTNEDLSKYEGKLDKITLSDVIGTLFDNVTCKTPTLLLLFGNVVNWLNEAKTDNIPYIEMTKTECEQFKSIFSNSVIARPELNAYVIFLIESFDIFIKNFDTLEEIVKPEEHPKIKNS